MREARFHSRAGKRTVRNTVPLSLALGSVLSGHVLVASANSMTTVIGSTTSNYTMYGAQDLLFRSVGTINTTLTPALTVDSSVTNSTITLQTGAKLMSRAGSGIGLLNNGQTNLISNSGLISGPQTAIDNQSSLTLISNTGTISGANAIVNTGSLGTIANAGTISGNISNSASSTLVITGGIGAAIGTLTGQSGIGTITNTSGNIDFASGNILLNDNINVGSHTVTNDGAALSLSNTISITGDYSQSAGTLTLAAGKTLVVSDTAALTGGTIATALSTTGNYLAGDSVSLISAGTLTASGVTASITGISGLDVSSVVTGTSLSAQYNNDYIGGTLASTSVSGTISSSYGVYVAGTGNLGTLSVTNTGSLAGSSYAIYNAGTLGAISNAGTISGNISLGSSALTITGGSGSSFGTLTGGTISSSASQLTLGSGNLLLDDDLVLNSGSGTLTSSGGTLQINGHKTLNGNYVQDASETLRIGVADGATATGATSDTGYGRLTVSGSATIASGSSVTLATTGSSYSFAQGQRYLVIVANSSGTNYNASSLNYSAVGYSGTVTGAVVSDGGNSDLVLTLGSTGGGSSPINAATASNSSEALRGLFNYTGTQGQLLNLFNAAAAIGSDSGKANAVGAQLSPVGVASTNFLISNASLGATSGILNNRLGQTRTGLSSGDAILDQSVWGQVFGSHISQGERDGLSGYRADFSGLIVGADRPIGERWQAGAAFSYGTSSSRETGSGAGSSIKSQALGVHGYAGFTADKWYLNLDTSVRRLSYDSHRKIEFPGFYGVATGTYHGTQYQASAEAGWPILLDSKLRGTTLTPIAGLSYSRLEQSGYTEKDGNGAALSVGATADSSLLSRLAVRLERGSDTRWGTVTSYAQLGWQHELRDTRLQTTARYVADTTGSTSFTSQGAKPQRDVAVLTLGTTLVKSEQLSLSGQLQVNSGSHYQEYGANLMLRYRF